MKPEGAESGSSTTLLYSMLLSASSSIGTERIASCGAGGRSGVSLSAGVLSGTDGVGVGDLGGVEGCTNSVKPEVEDMVWEEWWMNNGVCERVESRV